MFKYYIDNNLHYGVVIKSRGRVYANTIRKSDKLVDKILDCYNTQNGDYKLQISSGQHLLTSTKQYFLKATKLVAFGLICVGSTLTAAEIPNYSKRSKA